MSKQLVTASKFLSLLLRHKPEEIGLSLDAHGWAEIDEIVRLTQGSQTPLPRPLIERITATSDKQRFLISEDGQRIRANQGHSREVDLQLAPVTPPEELFHGTASRFLDSIRQQGLIKGNRLQVHLSPDAVTANKVGQRHGQPVVLIVASGEMARQGHLFYCSENGVWLVDSVPPEFIRWP